MRRLLPITIAMLALTPAWGQSNKTIHGSGKIVTENRTIEVFSEIENRLAAEYRIQIGKNPSFKITGDDNILPLIKYTVEEKRLIISTDKQYKPSISPVIHITVVDLKAAANTGSGDMHIKGVDNESFRLDISGSGDVHFMGQTKQLAVAVSGSGDIRLTGKTEALAADINGSGDVRAFELSADDAAVKIMGSGDANISASQTLSIQIYGSGDVKYKGSPAVTQSIFGSGDVRRRD